MFGDVGNPFTINEDLPPVVEGAEIFGTGSQRWDDRGGRRGLWCGHGQTPLRCDVTSDVVRGKIHQPTDAQHWFAPLRCQQRSGAQPRNVMKWTLSQLWAAPHRISALNG